MSLIVFIEFHSGLYEEHEYVTLNTNLWHASYPLPHLLARKISKFTVPTINDIFTNKTLKGTLCKHSTNLRSS